MMILSRLWYVISALLLAAAYYVVALAVGQFNRNSQTSMERALRANSQAVNYAMQLDARRRLDILSLPAVDESILKAMKVVKDTVPPAARDEAVKALRTFNEKLPVDLKSDVIFLTDRDGRLVAQVGFDAVNGSPDFELGGYASVFDALHGFMRDDTWVWGGRVARVVARPVQEDSSQPPAGALVGLRWIDDAFAKEIAKQTGTNLVFFAMGQRVAGAATSEGFKENLFDFLAADLRFVSEDKQFKDGRTDVRPLGTDENAGALYMRLPGDGWELGVGVAVVRDRLTMGSPLGFTQGADDADKKSVKLWIVLLLAIGVSALGIGFSFLEHTLPLREVSRQAERLKKGEIDVFHVPKFRSAYRSIASDINAGIQRVIEKGGGTARKPADLESILGPAPAQPNMSAFSFPQSQEPSMVPQQVPAAFPNAPPAVPPSGNRPPVPVRPGAPPAPPPRPPPPSASAPNSDRTVSMGTGPAAHPGPASGSGRGAAAMPAMPSMNAPTVPPRKNMRGGDEDEETMVAQPSADLLAATGANAAVTGEAAEWQKVYDEFVRTKRECNEPIDGLTFEKFQQTLKKNRDALVQRHGCKRVKFAVYVKEGRASLKATPVRE